MQPSLVTLADIGAHLALFFRQDSAPVAPEVLETLRGEAAQQVFRAFRDRLKALPQIDSKLFGELMKQVQKDTQVKGKQLWAPMRSAITLQAEGPDLALVVDVFGKDKTLARIERALAR